jgi:hypothetical protein
MSKGFLISRRNKNHLSKTYAVNPYHANRLLFVNYRNVYNRTIRAAKKMYYDNQFVANQSNVKKSWDLIFEVIKKTGKKQ